MIAEALADATQPTQPTEPTEPTGSLPRVLVVDDCSVIRGLLRRTLEIYSYPVSEAADGLDALEILQADADFALMIVDLVMPRMDGAALIARLRNEPSMAHIRILMLSAEEPGADPAHGADTWMQKPFLPSSVIRMVKQLLNQQ